MKIPNIFEKDTETETFAAGTTIFEEGQEGVVMYVVKSGEVELKVNGKCVETVGPEGFFGEMAVIEGGTRSASAIALEDTVLVPITTRRFQFMVQEVPFFGLAVMKGLSRRLRNVDMNY